MFKHESQESKYVLSITYNANQVDEVQVPMKMSCVFSLTAESCKTRHPEMSEIHPFKLLTSMIFKMA